MTNETNLELIKDLDFGKINSPDEILWMEINFNSQDDAFIHVAIDIKTGVIKINNKPTNEILNEDRLNRLKRILE